MDHPVRALVSIIVLLTFAGAAPSVAEAPPGDAQEPLAVVNAERGSFTATDDGYRLTLDDLAPRAVWFSDHPARSTGSYALAELQDIFFGGDDPPNAALEVVAGRAEGTVVIVEVSNPRLRRDGGRLSLDARVLSTDEVSTAAFADLTARATSTAPRRFGRAVLFLDGGCTTTNGSIAGLTGLSCNEALAVVDAFSGHNCGDQLDIGADVWTCTLAASSVVYSSFEGKGFVFA